MVDLRVDNNKEMKQIEIPIISQDLRQDEVCIRALKTFEFLDKVVDEVFDRIDARIARNMTRIDDVNKRFGNDLGNDLSHCIYGR